MSKGNIEDVETALEHFHDQTRVKFLLRRFLGKETQYEEINGHLFNKDDPVEPANCHNQGCEMYHKKIAECKECPAPLEGFDMDARLEKNQGGF